MQAMHKKVDWAVTVPLVASCLSLYCFSKEARAGAVAALFASAVSSFGSLVLEVQRKKEHQVGKWAVFGASLIVPAMMGVKPKTVDSISAALVILGSALAVSLASKVDRVVGVSRYFSSYQTSLKTAEWGSCLLGAILISRIYLQKVDPNGFFRGFEVAFAAGGALFSDTLVGIWNRVFDHLIP